MYYTEGFEQESELEEGEISPLHLPRPTKVKDMLFIGCQDSARNKVALKNCKITHILDLTGKSHFTTDFVYLTIERLDDSPCTDILSHFPRCMEFIEQGIEQGSGVLVHCAAGVSRSGAIIISYIMKVDKIPLHEALSLVKRVRPVVQPNCGFMKQLKMWEQMEYTINGNTRAHRLYLLEKLSLKYRDNGEIPDITSYQNPQNLESIDSEIIYCCINCQMELFSNLCIIEHAKGIGPHGKNWFCTTMECDSFYLEPLAWMGNLSKDGIHELNCPNCNQHFGNWTWKESNCSCTTVIYPSFQVKKENVNKKKNSRCDIVKPNSLS